MAWCAGHDLGETAWVAFWKAAAD